VVSAELELYNASNTTKDKLIIKSRGSKLGRCEPKSDQFSCTSSNKCVPDIKVCDGIPDCPDAEDENVQMCSRWVCRKESIRCENSDICIPQTKASLCTETEHKCPDKSDQSYCLHKVFTGCLANTSLGYKIVDCNSCFCDLRDKTWTGKGKRSLMYSAASSPNSKLHLVAKICMERTSNLFCDGEEDCLHGEDEDGELCYKKEEITKKVQTNVVTGEASTKDPVSSVETETINDDNNFLDLEYLDITIIVVIFFITCVTVVGVCFIIILVMYKVVKTKKKSSFQQASFAHFDSSHFR